VGLGESCIVRSFVICTRHKILFRQLNKDDQYGTYSEARSVDRILVGIPEGKRIFGSPKRKLVDDIKCNLNEIGWEGMEWINMAWNMDK
jgi:hypothetical protein